MKIAYDGIIWFRERLAGLRTVIEHKTYGMFYNSKSPKGSRRHIAKYIPYAKPPTITLCGDEFANFSSTSSLDEMCGDCQTILNFTKLKR